MLPAGDTDVLDIVLNELNPSGNPDVEAVVKNRYEVFQSLNPARFVIGISGFRRYFVAKLSLDLVVLLSFQHENAIYIINSDWSNLNKMPRFEVLNGNHRGFERIIISDGWENKLATTLKLKLIESNC